MTNEHMNEWALHAYADGELSAEQRAEVEALMARDPEAARKVADWQRQRELLKTAFDGVLDEPVPQQLAATLADLEGRVIDGADQERRAVSRRRLAVENDRRRVR